MTSDLFVAFPGCRALLKVHTFQNGVLTESLLYTDNRFLHLLFLFESLPFGLLSLFLFNRIIEKRYLLGVGLSMICYTKAQKIIESSLRRDPVKRAHGKVIVFTKMDGKLSFEVVEGVKRMSCVKVLIILAV